jgi:C-terminal processing protease CtpA/Prc
LNSLKVGSLKINHLLCVSVPWEKDISLGTSFWRQFVIQISYEKASICFLKTQITEQQAWIGLGIVLDFLSEEGWVIGVVEDSPAWEHNLRGGEVLVAIDDWQVQSLDAEQITTLLNPPEGTLKRCKFLDMDGQEKIFDLVSRKII